MGILYKWTTTVNGNPWAYMGPGSVTILRTPTWLGRFLGRRESRARLRYNHVADRWYFDKSGNRAGLLLGWKLDGIVVKHRRLARTEDAEEAKIPNWDEV